MKRQFKVDAYFYPFGLPLCAFLQLDNSGEKCRLLFVDYDSRGEAVDKRPLKARKIHMTNSGRGFVTIRGRRLYLDRFTSTGSEWSAFPKDYTIEY